MLQSENVLDFSIRYFLVTYEILERFIDAISIV